MFPYSHIRDFLYLRANNNSTSSKTFITRVVRVASPLYTVS